MHSGCMIFISEFTLDASVPSSEKSNLEDRMLDHTQAAPLAKDKERPNGKKVEPQSTAGRCEGRRNTHDRRKGVAFAE